MSQVIDLVWKSPAVGHTSGRCVFVCVLSHLPNGGSDVLREQLFPDFYLCSHLLTDFIKIKDPEMVSFDPLCWCLYLYSNSCVSKRTGETSHFF